MKVAISATDNNLDAHVEPAFGRCKYFIIYDTDTNTHKIIQNLGIGMNVGAGSTAVQIVIEQGATEIITGKVGIKSRPLLERAGITISENRTGRIADILSTFEVPRQPEKTATQQNPVPVNPVPVNPVPVNPVPINPVPIKDSHQSDRNPLGYCFCQACGYRGAGDPGEPCFKQRCPMCNCGLERKYR